MADNGGPAAGPAVASCLLFPQPGPRNTEATLVAAARRAAELDLRTVCVASTTGRTGVRAAELLAGRGLVVVTHSTGFTGPDRQELRPENRARIEAAGGRILTCQHAFGGIGRAVRKRLATYELDEIVAYSLRIFGEGAKVAVEIALMAADAGLLSTSAPCLSIGGTGAGADTALVLKPANAQAFLDLRVLEFVAKPRLA